MDNNEIFLEYDESMNQQSTISSVNRSNLNNQMNMDLLVSQIKEPETPTSQIAHPIKQSLVNVNPNNMTRSSEDRNNLKDKLSLEPICHVKMDSIIKLKDSTRKLLCLIEEIQTKTHSKNMTSEETPKWSTSMLKAIPESKSSQTALDMMSFAVLSKLEHQTKILNAIYIEDEDDDCSIYKRLTRKCHCLNEQKYNDFIIHFNEDTKYFTGNIGEIIKNMRILKKFLYMGCNYTKNALLFLNEGLQKCSHIEKVEIIQACSHADICNIFEDYSIVIMCISWLCKMSNNDSNYLIQALAASLLYKLSQLEEGRRYLNLNSKITNDTKKVLKKHSAKLKDDIVETLNATLSALHPPPTIAASNNLSYLYKPINEGLADRTVNALTQFREYMTSEEIFTHLEILLHMSDHDNGKTELITYLPALLNIFKQILKEYNDSEMNIIITNILNNIVSRSMVKEPEKPQGVVIVDTATEPIQMKSVMNQVPTKKNLKKSHKGNSMGLSPNKHKQPSRRQVSDWQPTPLNRSRKFAKDLRSSIIVVPMEK